ncbi:hypothetical protein ACJMK2_043709 [Sinanodonta woodiana]|uniref:F-box domain-containing protein n=1 Tax=Sinanodonta woodiana TaxID=1069815 RepID=A0ABD3W0J8_SINWO
MAAGPSWSIMPSVPIVEIFSYLSQKDRLRASSSCKRWRSCLFHPSLWSGVVLNLSYSKRQRTRFLVERCGRFLREVVVCFNSNNPTEVRECLRILEVLSENKVIASLCLQPASCHLEWTSEPPFYVTDRYLNCIEKIICNSRKLQHLSLGSVDQLLEHSHTVLELLSHYHCDRLKALHLASVKEDSENYGIIDLNVDLIHSFKALQHLSIDYDYLSSSLLEAFLSPEKDQLERLCIHVHGIEPDHEKITNETWRKLQNRHPKLEVTINLIHSYEGVASLLDILQPCLPLTNFRQFFCSNLNLAAVDFISNHYSESLRSFYVIDGFQDGYPNVYISTTDEDPFVMMAWRCSKLEEFTLIGYEVLDDNVVAIARLRGQNLKTFNIPYSCVSTVYETDRENAMLVERYVKPELADMVSSSLGWSWQPLPDNQTPRAVYDDQADAETAYMKLLHLDQAWKCN